MMKLPLKLPRASADVHADDSPRPPPLPPHAAWSPPANRLLPETTATVVAAPRLPGPAQDCRRSPTPDKRGQPFAPVSEGEKQQFRHNTLSTQGLCRASPFFRVA